MSQIVRKCPISQCWKIIWKIPGSDFRRWWPPKFNQFVVAHIRVSAETCTKIIQ